MEKLNDPLVLHSRNGRILRAIHLAGNAGNTFKQELSEIIRYNGRTPQVCVARDAEMCTPEERAKEISISFRVRVIHSCSQLSNARKNTRKAHSYCSKSSF